MGWKSPLEEGLATPSSFLAWRIPWTKEPGWLWSMGPQRVRHKHSTQLYSQHLEQCLVMQWAYSKNICLTQSMQLCHRDSTRPRPHPHSHRSERCSPWSTRAHRPRRRWTAELESKPSCKLNFPQLQTDVNCLNPCKKEHLLLEVTLWYKFMILDHPLNRVLGGG